jgi:hypothetical protein
MFGGYENNAIIYYHPLVIYAYTLNTKEAEWNTGLEHSKEDGVTTLPPLDRQYHSLRLRIGSRFQGGKENRKSCIFGCYLVPFSAATFTH